MASSDLIPRDEADKFAQKQVRQAWLQTGISIMVGWLLGQFNLHMFFPHLFG
jgi:hypothetical protein